MNQYTTLNNTLYSQHNLAAVVHTKEGTRGTVDSPSELQQRSSQADYFKGLVLDYVHGQGKEYLQYLEKQGHSPAELEGIGSADLEEKVAAAVLRYNGKAIMLSNRDFHYRSREIAELYDLPLEEAQQFILDHELTHVYKVTDENQVLQLQEKYYLKKAENSTGQEKEKYLRLAQAAQQHRQKQAN